jgi:hypothetical protein
MILGPTWSGGQRGHACSRRVADDAIAMESRCIEAERALSCAEGVLDCAVWGEAGGSARSGYLALAHSSLT